VKSDLQFSSCQWRLASIWLIGAVLLFGIFLVQLAGGIYGTETDQAWGWLLPNIIHILTMIGGAVGYQFARPETKILVNRFAYRATLAISALYLLLLLGVLLLIPLAASRNVGPLAWFSEVRVLITALAGIVTAVLGAFFVSSKPEKPA